ncbi:hypothetical protein AW27_026425 [Streptomyces sp. PCS3-D2]|uniref:hypothetical protein n=1 Tax=Streptomyces sp. PCS3-D2 TaxID=1460244 RepID=UPI00272AFF41|nr:hypothetical protein [Streptomyces sp. PCS3-D2]WKV74744.1 hypothetical protein AW27_026425 [Streptomyces sp. PCS3-D2]
MTDLLKFFIAWCTLASLAGLVLGYLGYRANRHKDAAPSAPEASGRHTASTITDDALDALYARAEQAEAALAAFHEGEEPQPDWRATSTPAQWIWLWNRATLEQRLDVAARFMANGATAEECVLMNHRATVEEARRMRAAIARVRNRCQSVRDRVGPSGMINASQILGLLSAKWPDGNYEAPLTNAALDEPKEQTP